MLDQVRGRGFVCTFFWLFSTRARVINRADLTRLRKMLIILAGCACAGYVLCRVSRALIWTVGVLSLTTASLALHDAYPRVIAAAARSREGLRTKSIMIADIASAHLGNIHMSARSLCNFGLGVSATMMFGLLLHA